MIWLSAAALFCITLALGWLAWQRNRHLVVVVYGQSMVPAFHHGDRVLVRRVPPTRLRTGQIVVADLPSSIRPLPPGLSDAERLHNSRLIKRIAAVPGDALPFPIDGVAATVPRGHLVLLGDNPDASGDSRQFGLVPIGAVIGVALRTLSAASGNHHSDTARTL